MMQIFTTKMYNTFKSGLTLSFKKEDKEYTEAGLELKIFVDLGINVLMIIDKWKQEKSSSGREFIVKRIGNKT